MSDWNLELPKFKAARNGEVELRPTTGGKRQARKWKVMGRFKNIEYVAHRGASKEACEAWIAKQARTYYVGHRNAPQAVHDEARDKAQARAQAFHIVPPAGLT